MSLVSVRKLSCIFLILAINIFSGCHSKAKKGQETTNYSNVKDTVSDPKTIARKANAMVMTNKWDEASNYISANLHRFKGPDRAFLLNERGGVYYLKDDFDNAIADYLIASEMEPDNSTYLLNVAKTYESMESLNNASLFAKRLLELKSATDSDKVVAQNLIQRCDRIHAGH